MKFASASNLLYLRKDFLLPFPVDFLKQISPDTPLFLTSVPTLALSCLKLRHPQEAQTPFKSSYFQPIKTLDALAETLLKAKHSKANYLGESQMKPTILILALVGLTFSCKEEKKSSDPQPAIAITTTTLPITPLIQLGVVHRLMAL